MPYKITDRVNVKGEVIKNSKDEEDENVYIHFTDVGEIIALNDIVKDFVGKEVKISITHDEKVLE